MDIFTRPTEYYRRDIKLVDEYVASAAKYLALQTGQDIESCITYVKDAIAPNGKFPIQDPDVAYLVRGRNGDRSEAVTTYSEYLQSAFEQNEILAPTMTSYVAPEQKESILAGYIDENLSLRKRYKKDMFAAAAAKDVRLETIKNSQQSSQKLKNNGLSGAFCSPYTTVYNKTGHSTLTSVTRCATSYGNANNERFLNGNRHYWAPDVVKANIVSILNHTNLNEVERVLQKYSLKAPSVDLVMSAIQRGTTYYWRIPDQMTIIESMVKSMTPIERAAYLYTGDCYHLAKANDKFVRQLLTSLSTKASESISVDETDAELARSTGNLTTHALMVCVDETKGTTLRDLKEENPVGYGVVGATLRKFNETLEYYKDFIQLFWISDNLPSSIYSLPSIVRRGVITSDTDSTIFTVAEWTQWYRGKLDFTQESTNIASTMVLFAGELIRHILARVSANMGVGQKNVKLLSMKNEYFMPVFVLTSRAKHYFAYIAAQEGNVFEKLKTDIKGVALRSSNVAPEIMKDAKRLMEQMMDTVMAGEEISMEQVFSYIAERENDIRRSVEGGNYAYMSKMQIKSVDSYKNAEKSNYSHFLMWQDVFGPKYGMADPPPYRAVKVSVELDNPTKLKEWLDSMKDQELAERMRQWLARNQRTSLGTLMLPESILSIRGVPPEIVQAIDIRKLVAQITSVFYLILESLGVFMQNKDNTRLVSDNDWLTSV